MTMYFDQQIISRCGAHLDPLLDAEPSCQLPIISSESKLIVKHHRPDAANASSFVEKQRKKERGPALGTTVTTQALSRRT